MALWEPGAGRVNLAFDLGLHRMLATLVRSSHVCPSPT